MIRIWHVWNERENQRRVFTRSLWLNFSEKCNNCKYQDLEVFTIQLSNHLSCESQSLRSMPKHSRAVKGGCSAVEAITVQRDDLMHSMIDDWVSTKCSPDGRAFLRREHVVQEIGDCGVRCELLNMAGALGHLLTVVGGVCHILS